MFRKLKLRLAKLLHKLVERIYSEFTEEEFLQRIGAIRKFFHEVLPTIDEKWVGKAVIEGGYFNYYRLPSGNLPKYDFVYPEIPLYVIVSGINSASWEQVCLRGITREKWEEYNCDLAFIEQATSLLSTIGMAAAPRLLIIKWNDPIDNFSLVERLQEVLK
jgi:hypothetical protein